jgi:hypothetical protein
MKGSGLLHTSEGWPKWSVRVEGVGAAAGLRARGKKVDLGVALGDTFNVVRPVPTGLAVQITSFSTPASRSAPCTLHTRAPPAAC